jgi:hypothetical protein
MKKIEVAQLAGQLGFYVFVDGMLDADIPASKTAEQAVGLALRAYPKKGKHLKRGFTGDMKTYNYSYRANPRATATTSSGDAVAAHELFLFAINESELYRQRIVPVINNLRKKVKKGVYRADLALKLWRYVADDAAKRYTHGGYGTGKGYGIFTVPIREAAARELAEYYDENLYGESWEHRLGNPIKGTRRNPIKRPGKYEGELYVTKYAHENDDESIGDVQELGWFGRFSGKIKGRGPFHIITQENDQGFVYGKLYDTEAELNTAWDEIVAEYEKFYEGQGDE